VVLKVDTRLARIGIDGQSEELLGQGADVVSMIKGLVLLLAVGIDVWNKQQGRPSIIGFMTRRWGRKDDPEASPVFEPNKTYQAPPVEKTRGE